MSKIKPVIQIEHQVGIGKDQLHLEHVVHYLEVKKPPFRKFISPKKYKK
jgi:hypothetical protein